MTAAHRQHTAQTAAPAASSRTAPTASAWLTGSDAPEKRQLKVGFMPLTDSASIVMASVLAFDQKHGIKFVLKPMTSWASVRDQLLLGELDMAQALYGMVYGQHLGIGSPATPMAVLMTLNHNGQGLTLSRRLAEQGAVDAESLSRLMAREPRTYRFAQTFPTGTHALWLYYWLASAGVNPFTQASVITVPPSHMVQHLRRGGVDGFCAGEPWNQSAISDGSGVTVATSQHIWPDHPEKVLGCTADFVAQHPHTARAAVMAVLEASRWIDASAANQQRTAQILAGDDMVGTRLDALAPRLQGDYDNGLGQRWHDRHRLRFFNDGAVNFPYLSDGMWFMTQHKRWGLLRQHPDYLGVARQVNQIALYREAANALRLPLPASAFRSSTLMDGQRWDGTHPERYADGFLHRAPPLPALDEPRGSPPSFSHLPQGALT